MSLAAVVVSALALVGAGRADAASTPIEVTCPGNHDAPGYEIDVPGKYVLAKAVTNCVANGIIDIHTSNVTLDLGGRRVDGDASDKPYECVVANASNLTGIKILNGTVSDCVSGVHIESATASTVAGVTATRIAGTGILAGSGNIITGNKVSRAADDGIKAGSENTISGNVSTQNGASGIWASGGSNTIKGNVATGNLGLGIRAANNDVIVSNRASGNGQFGLSASSNSSMKGNIVDGNGGGVAVVGSNTIESNTISGNFSLGLNLADTGNVVSKNKVSFNNGGISTTTGGQRIVGNTLTGNDGTGISINGASTLTDVVIDGNAVSGSELDGVKLFQGIDAFSSPSSISKNKLIGNGGKGVALPGAIIGHLGGVGTNTCDGNGIEPSDAGLCA